MKLKDAYFCIACEEIFELKDCVTRRVCPSCTQSSTLNISIWLKCLTNIVDSIPEGEVKGGDTI